jgi:hypothetical protein
MKKYILLLLTGFALISSNIYAQTLGDIINQNQGNRDRTAKDQDDRSVMIGLYGEYYLSSDQVNGQNAFTGGLGVGLKIYIPCFTTGDGTNGGDQTGDFTFSASYTDWIGGVDNNNLYDTNPLPDWTTYTGLVGFRFGVADVISFEPQAGYSYGAYGTAPNAYSSAKVSGITYGLKIGLTIVHGMEAYGKLQSTNTVLFGSTFDYGVGLEFRF